ncbi:hypothetical protein [Clostridium thermosuccinogenes]|nr:hypothetical protein [Pseudoclostridium thermosuccinogenes]
MEKVIIMPAKVIILLVGLKRYSYTKNAMIGDYYAAKTTSTARMHKY